MVGVEALQQPVEAAAGRERMEADAKLSVLAAPLHPGGLDGAIKDADGVFDLIDETASGFGKAYPARVAVEENDAKVFL